MAVETSERRGPRYRASPDSADRRVLALVLVVAAASAVLTATSGVEPTTTPVLDPVLTAAAGALVALVGAWARPWTWLVGALVAAPLAVDTVPLLLVIVAAALGLVAVIIEPHRREILPVLGSVAGLTLAAALVRLRIDVTFALPTLVAVVALVPMAVSAARRSRRHRRVALLLTAVVSVVVVLAAASLGAVALIAANDAQGGVRQAQRALDALGDAEADEAREWLAQSAASFRSVEDAAGAWWAVPARLVPVAAQHHRAVADLASAGRSLTEVISDTVAVAEVESIRVRGGRIDVDALAELEQPAARSLVALRDAVAAVDQARSGWLVAPLRDRVDRFDEALADAVEPAELALEGTRVVPDLLGRGGPRHYAVIFGNPAETREFGGFTGSVGTLTADNGDLDFDEVRRGPDLSREMRELDLAPVEGLPAHMTASRPERWAQNWTETVDPDDVLRVVQQLWPILDGRQVDGFLYVDPLSLADLIEITGPVELEALDQPLGADRAADFLLREQYLLFETEASPEEIDRRDVLSDLADITFDRLTSGDMPGPRGLNRVLGPAVEARHLLFYVPGDDETMALLRRVGLAGGLEPEPGVDLVHVTASNTRSNKMDAYIDRSIELDVRVDGDEVEATVTVEMTNRAVAATLPTYVAGNPERDGQPPAMHRVNVGIYSPWRLEGVQIDGADARAGSSTEGRHHRHAVTVHVPEGQTVRVEFVLRGSHDPGFPYELSVVPFAGHAPDQLRASIDDHGRTATFGPEPHERRIDLRAVDDGGR